MNRMSLSLAGSLAAALVFSAVPAQAAVTAKDAPSQSDITKAFPELAGGTFSTDKGTKTSVPGATCGSSSMVRLRSAASIAGISPANTEVVTSGVGEAKSVSAAKSFVSKYKSYIKKCATFTQPTSGAQITIKLTKAPKLGDSALKFTSTTTLSGVTQYTDSVLVRDGKRLAFVVALDDAAVSSSAVNQLAKVAAKKMK